MLGAHPSPFSWRRVGRHKTKQPTLNQPTKAGCPIHAAASCRMGGIAQTFFGGLLLALLFTTASLSPAQTGDQAWLGHTLWHDSQIVKYPVHPLGQSVLEQTAAAELKRGILRLYGVSSVSDDDFGDRIVIGTADEVSRAYPDVAVPINLPQDAYWIAATPSRLGASGHGTHIVVAGGDERGALYGSFALLRFIAESNSVPASRSLKLPQCPSAGSMSGQPRRVHRARLRGPEHLL